jgi:hypothetical protein
MYFVRAIDELRALLPDLHGSLMAQRVLLVRVIVSPSQHAWSIGAIITLPRYQGNVQRIGSFGWQ